MKFWKKQLYRLISASIRLHSSLILDLILCTLFSSVRCDQSWHCESSVFHLYLGAISIINRETRSCLQHFRKFWLVYSFPRFCCQWLARDAKCITVTFDPSWGPMNGRRLYVNNVLVASTTSMATSYTGSSLPMYVTLGNSLNGTVPCATGLAGSSTPFTGDMDELRIYSRELSADDVCVLYTI